MGCKIEFRVGLRTRLIQQVISGKRYCRHVVNLFEHQNKVVGLLMGRLP